MHLRLRPLREERGHLDTRLSKSGIECGQGLIVDIQAENLNSESSRRRSSFEAEEDSSFVISRSSPTASSVTCTRSRWWAWTVRSTGAAGA